MAGNGYCVCEVTLGEGLVGVDGSRGQGRVESVSFQTLATQFAGVYGLVSAASRSGKGIRDGTGAGQPSCVWGGRLAGQGTLLGCCGVRLLRFEVDVMASGEKPLEPDLAGEKGE